MSRKLTHAPPYAPTHKGRTRVGDPIQVLVGILDVFTARTAAEIDASETEQRDPSTAILAPYCADLAESVADLAYTIDPQALTAVATHGRSLRAMVPLLRDVSVTHNDGILSALLIHLSTVLGGDLGAACAPALRDKLVLLGQVVDGLERVVVTIEANADLDQADDDFLVDDDRDDLEPESAEDAEYQAHDTVTAAALLDQLRTLPGLKLVSIVIAEDDEVAFDLAEDGVVRPPVHCRECAVAHDREVIAETRHLDVIPDLNAHLEKMIIHCFARAIGGDGSSGGVLVVRQVLDTTITIPLRANPGRAARANVKHHVLPRKQISCAKLMDGGWRPCSLAETEAIAREQEDGETLIPELGVEFFALPETWGKAPRVLRSVEPDAGPTFS